jgi:hypothetical protein
MSKLIKKKFAFIPEKHDLGMGGKSKVSPAAVKVMKKKKKSFSEALNN